MSQIIQYCIDCNYSISILSTVVLTAGLVLAEGNFITLHLKLVSWKALVFIFFIALLAGKIWLAHNYHELLFFPFFFFFEQRHLLTLIETIWHLCEILFIETLPGIPHFSLVINNKLLCTELTGL